jgi:hypothetical protein
MDDATIIRFYDKVDKRGQRECWPWSAYKERDGRGTFRIGSKKYKAPRVMMMLMTGREIPKEKIVCHTCDNPSCVNPKHLYLGTPKQNTSDMLMRGRHHVSNHGHDENTRRKMSLSSIVRPRDEQGRFL